MKEEEKEIKQTFITLGLVIKLPYGDIDKLKRWIIDNNYLYIYGKPTLGRILLKEILPSSSGIEPDGDVYEE